MLNKTKLIEIAAEKFCTTSNVIRGKSRTQRASYARDAASYLMHLQGYTHEEIARCVNRHRTSVSKGLDRVHERMRSNAKDCIVYHRSLNEACLDAGIPIDEAMEEAL
jgi:chromosomal replication initiation ATPase DnaA